MVSIKTSSYLDEENIVSNPDYEDIVVAVKGNTYNDDYHLPQSQVDRLDNDVVFDSLRFILDNLFIDNCIITGTEYQKIKKNLREKIKRSFKNIFVSHMKRDYLTRAESGVVSTSIPILLWRVQGKSFSEMVSLRYSYLRNR